MSFNSTAPSFQQTRAPRGKGGRSSVLGAVGVGGWCAIIQAALPGDRTAPTTAARFALSPIQSAICEPIITVRSLGKRK
jgi:hypothetical protein